MTKNEIVELLAAHRTLGGAPRGELEWIAEHGTLQDYQQGEVLARPPEPVDSLFIILSGRVSIYMNRGTGARKMMEWIAGEVTGLLPYSRLTNAPGETMIEEPTRAVLISRERLPDLIRCCYEVTGILVHVMTDRARRFTSADLRDEKMISLGKLAAGFAHEVNNPASAALRDARALGETLIETDIAARTLFHACLSKEQLGAIDRFCDVCRSEPAGLPRSGLELADREEELGDWLRGHGISDGLAVDLARTPATVRELDRLGVVLSGPALQAALSWIAGACSALTLVADIERAARRIHELVAAAKGFTHMDRAQVTEGVDVRRGLMDTVALLRGKAKVKSVGVALDVPPDLPLIRAYGAEVNQVWMNLIDNAIDAVPDHGQVNIVAWLEGPDVFVTVTDNGPGVPAEIREIIFDPFFTTKPVGEGTGLGLDIVRRVVHWHNGDIRLESRPGRTEFRVRFPIGGPG
jgi:signal transduction histidine kinase